MWLALVTLFFAALLLLALFRRRRSRSRRHQRHDQFLDFEQTANSSQASAMASLEKFMYASIHSQMRDAVDKVPFVRSQKFRGIVTGALSKVEAEYHSIVIYLLRWLDHGYPGPPPNVCEMNRAAGARRRFVSIGAGLHLDRQKPDAQLLQWASEIEGAFLRANTLEDMRVVAMHYPILLRPAVQGGIDAEIIHDLAEPERTAYFEKLRHLQRLREEIEGHPVESWWRPIDRQYGGHFSQPRDPTS